MTTFKGYIRPDGSVGARNHVIAIPTVSCVNGIIEKIAREVPGVIPLVHTAGCGRGSIDVFRHHRVLTGICKNPNNYAVIVVGLGCEPDRADIVAKAAESIGKPAFSVIAQEVGGSEKAAEIAIAQARKFMEEAKQCKREDAPVSKIILGTNCGGSDALSGITANPAIGYVSDWVVDNGGISLLTETTELIGTEDLLAARAVDEKVAKKIYRIINQAEKVSVSVLGEMASRHIARGNLEGGMSTIQEKALGCVHKGGTRPVTAVIDYAQPLPKDSKGLIIMDGPGYDPDSLTGLFACGAQVTLFSSGRGNPLGFPNAPVIKYCSNSETYEKVGGDGGDMDINCGRIITEGISPEQLGKECVENLIEVLSGKLTMPELHGHGGALCIHTSTPST